MRYLYPEYWKNFKRDGKLFEQLSKVLIEYEYHQKNFYIVGGPNDGGKDVIKEISLLGNYRTQIWAQCKFYHNTLSFDDVSFTLLMAYLKNTNQVLIFSYSKVSDSFLDNLNEYIARTAKDVILYADEELEELILKHQMRLLEEHPEFFEQFPHDRHTEINPFRVDYQLYIDGRRITNTKVSISLNSICEIIITITNKTASSQEISIACVEDKISRMFTFLNGKANRDCTILPNHSVTFKYHIKLKRNIDKTRLPIFELLSDCRNEKICTDKKLNCRWLADTALIGNRYYDALHKINSAIQSPHFQVVYIYGKSGTGKSRLIKEAQTECVRSGKRMIYIDSEKKDISCKKWIDLLCSQMTLLPLFHEKVTVLSDTDETAMEYATKILYDDSFDIKTEWEKTAKFLFQLMENDKFVLALDNIQHFDMLALKIIDYLISLLKYSRCESDIFLGINTDYIYKNSEFEKFFTKLKYASGNSSEFYTGIQVEGFEPCDSELYIRECLSYQAEDINSTQIDYERAIEKIAGYCGGNPFYIQQYLLFLYQKNIITRSQNTLYYFRDVKKFFKSFYELPQSIESLISERERLFLANRTEDITRQYQQTIYLLNLTKSLPEAMYYDMIGNQALLEALLNLGFLTLEDGAVVPIHSFFALYYSYNYPVNSVPRILLEQFVATASRADFIAEMPLPIFWAKSRLGITCFSDLQLVCKQINSWDFDCSAFSFCLKPVCATAEKHSEELGIEEYLKLYYSVCTKLDQALGIKESIPYYRIFLTSFLENGQLYSEDSEHFDSAMHLVVEGLIHLVNLEEYKTCIEIINQLRKVAASFSEAERLKLIYQTNRCMIMIYNRKDIVSDAIKAARENLDILQTNIIDSKFQEHMVLSAMRSIGNTYFYSTVAYKHRREICESWTNSFEHFITRHGMDVTKDFSNQPKVAAFAKGLAADIIAGREILADKKAIFFENAFNRMHMMYYEMQIRLLMAIYLTWKYSDRALYRGSLAEIDRYIDQTLDIAAIYGRQLTTINAFHLRGAVHFLAGNYEVALDNYRITADLLIRYLKTAEDFKRWEYFWIDLARVFRKCDRNASVEVIQYCDKHTQSIIQEICTMGDRVYRDYEECYVPMAALTDKKQRINLPKL